MSDFGNQTVQWFPGHMAKTRRLIKESLSLVDAVTEIIDARIPLSSANPELSDIISGKPRIILLNKCDIADENATQLWIRHYKAMGIPALAVDCRSGKGLNAYLPLVREVLIDKIDSNIQKGMAGRALRVMVVGIPNTGKSSFINRMAGRNRAKVADRPGVTRQNNWFAVGNSVELLDTPGVLWPKFDDPAVGDRLAFIGSVRDDILDSETLAVRLLEVLCADYPERLSERYSITDFASLSAGEVLEMIGKKRGMLIKGGEVDTERASNILLDEYRGGKLGRITLERP
ncbi:MAG: ribosome biogenesis GTPase YlqF [Clostridiales bacterium]|nr:ribosome biogenesis GTPase YlqF [Clostridiales bacterium]